MSVASPFFIVGIGASAGGIEPLKKLTSLLPSTGNAAFVVIQHLHRSYQSQLEKLLSLYTKMKVRRILSGEQINADTIYVVPEHSYALLKEGKLILRKRLPQQLVHYGIDFFFESLAEEVGSKAIGIVLSGANEDGAQGAKAISEKGGTVFVQDPDTAKFPRMPEAVIRIDSPYEIDDPEKLAKALKKIITFKEIS